jgi:predicted ATPase/DNA-binding SARP family transcriptional activator
MLIDPWEIQLLGTLTLRRRDLQIDHLPTQKTGLLLAYLAAYPTRTHTREALTERFWPGSETQAGRVSLRQALASLRRLLEPPDTPSGSVLIADRLYAALRPESVHTDLHAFQEAASRARRTADLPERIRRLQEALHWYRGPFLDGAYEEWALDERHRLQTRYLEILLQLTDTLVESGRLIEAKEAARRILETDSLHEEAHGRLMQIYAAQGEYLKARRQYQTLCRRLMDELGLEPSSPVQSLYRQLEEMERQPPAPAAPVVSSASSAEERAAPTPSRRDDLPRLPVTLTRFFGRGAELAQIGEWLNDLQVRLITLTGPGGIGKTRLAVESARRADSFGSAITFVSLADLSDPNHILLAILQALRLPSAGIADPLQRLVVALESGPHLLLLDNFEHLLDAGAETVLTLLERIGNTVLLVTSRQALNLPGEHELALSPLSTPRTQLHPEALISYPTVQMLVDRMRARRPDFQVTPHNASAVATLCERLEGLPLAVELAAGWARDLTVGQMLERMEHRFDLLISRQRGVPLRHQSLHAMVDWSYRMLPPSLQQIFRRLSVFRGGWTQETAVIAREEGESHSCETLIHDLRTLQERSFISAKETNGRMRYRMLETLREFGQEMMEEAETRQTQTRHAMRFLALAQEANAHLRGPQQVYWLDYLEEEQENLRAALDHLREEDPRAGLRLANALYWFWYVRGHYREGEERLTALLDRCPEEAREERARGLLAAGHLANCQSNNAAAFSRYEAARRLSERIGDAEGVAHTLCMMGNAAHETLEIDRATQLCSESVARYRALNHSPGLIMALFYLANILVTNDRIDEGVRLYQEAYQLAETQSDIRFQSLLTFCIGDCQRLQGRYDRALSRFRESLAFQRTLREPLPLTYLLRSLVSVAIHRERWESAARLFGAMTGLRRKIGYLEALHEKPLLDALQTTLHTRLPSSVYEAAMREARELDFTQCLEMASLEADLI